MAIVMPLGHSVWLTVVERLFGKDIEAKSHIIESRRAFDEREGAVIDFLSSFAN